MRKTIEVYADELPPSGILSSIHKRQWLKCPTCGTFQYYDYIPNVMSNPIYTSICGHGTGQKFQDFMIYVIVSDLISPASFRKWANAQYQYYIDSAEDMTPERKKDTFNMFPTVESCFAYSGVVTSDWSDIEAMTERAIVTAIAYTSATVIKDVLDKYKPDQYPRSSFIDVAIGEHGFDKDMNLTAHLELSYRDMEPLVFFISMPEHAYNDDKKLEEFIRTLHPEHEYTFEIEQYELHVALYKVQAKSRAEAIALLIEGHDSNVDMIQTDFIETVTDRGMSVSDITGGEVEDICLQLGRPMMREIIPGIRSVKRTDD